MAIAVRSSGSATWSVVGTSHGVSIPSGTQAGDLMVAAVTIGWGFGGPFTTSAPSGWAAIAENVGGTGASNTQVVSAYYRIAQAGDTSWTFSASGGNDFGGAIQTFSGVDPVTPIDATGTGSTNSGSTTLSANSVTTVTDNAWELIATSAWNGGTTTATGFTALNGPSGPEYVALLYNTTPVSPAGSTGSVTLTNSATGAGETLAAIPFALRPDTSVHATAAATLGALSAAAAGTFLDSASAAPGLGALAISAHAFAGAFGSASPTLGPLTASAAGTCVLYGHAGITLGNTAAAASGTFQDVAHASIALHNTAAVAHAAMSTTGSAAIGLRGMFALAGNQSIYYLIYAGSPGNTIDYDHPIGSVGGTSWTSDPLSPGTWSFGVRAASVNGIELNLDCSLQILISAGGLDITNTPLPPTGLRAHAKAGGAIVIEWAAGITSTPAKAASGFHVYTGTTGTPNYASPVATVAANTAIGGAYQTTLSGLVDGTIYTIGIRAYNGTAEESNTTTVSVKADASGPLPVVGLGGAAIV